MPSMCGCFSRFPACTVSLFICLYACEFPVGTEYNITVYVSFGSSMKVKVKVKSLSRVRLFVTTWTVAYQTPPSMGFSRQEYWSGLPLPSPRQTLHQSFSFLVRLSLSFTDAGAILVPSCSTTKTGWGCTRGRPDGIPD